MDTKFKTIQYSYSSPVSLPFCLNEAEMWESGHVKLLIFCHCVPHGLIFFWNPQFVWSKKNSRWPSFKVRKLWPIESIIQSISKKSIKFKDFFEIDRIFCLLGPSLRTWKLGHRKIFSLHTNWGFQEKFYPWGTPDVLQNHKSCTFAKNILSRKV